MDLTLREWGSLIDSEINESRLTVGRFLDLPHIISTVCKAGKTGSEDL